MLHAIVLGERYVLTKTEPKKATKTLPIIESRYAPWGGVPVRVTALVNEYGSYYGDEFQEVPLREAHYIAVNISRIHGKRCQCDKCRGLSSVWDQERWIKKKEG